MFIPVYECFARNRVAINDVPVSAKKHVFPGWNMDIVAAVNFIPASVSRSKVYLVYFLFCIDHIAWIFILIIIKRFSLIFQFKLYIITKAMLIYFKQYDRFISQTFL